jgi:thymidine kinase
MQRYEEVNARLSVFHLCEQGSTPVILILLDSQYRKNSFEVIKLSQVCSQKFYEVKFVMHHEIVI